MKNRLHLVMELCVVAGLMLVAGCDIKVSDYRAEKFQEIKSKVEHEPAWGDVMQKVLDARHGTVRVKAVEVEDLVVQTLGDEPTLKRNLSNLKSIDVKFRITWDGAVHKDGFTCTTFVFDKDWNVKRIIPGETNAAFDLAGSAQGAQKHMSRFLQGAKAKMGELVDTTREKWEEAKPQLKEELKNLEMQINDALRRASEAK